MDDLSPIWDSDHIKALLGLPRSQVDRLKDDPWHTWIQKRGGIKAIQEFLRRGELLPDHHRMLSVILDNRGKRAEVYADILGMERTTYFNRLPLLLDELSTCLNAWKVLDTTSTVQHNLPAQTTSLIGREREINRVVSLLKQPMTRLVTLVGTGGIGKTRVSLHVAEKLLDDFADGIFFIELAAVNDTTSFISTIAQALGILEEIDIPKIESLKTYLQSKELLLIFDNFEHILDEAPIVSRLLMKSPRLKILITSRSVLHIRGEHIFEIPPLSLPDIKQSYSASQLLTYDSIALFVERIQEVKPDFVLTDRETSIVAKISFHLDGIPLAIELVAVRARLFSLPSLLDRLNLNFLTRGPQDLPIRQRSLRDTIEWSYHLLDKDEQKIFARLSVFAGSFTVEGAESICDDIDCTIIDAMGGLIDKSLLQQINGRSEHARFRLLETIREYAHEVLNKSGDIFVVQQKHANYYLKLAEIAEEEIVGSSQRNWLDRLDDEHDNIRKVLNWSFSQDDIEIAARLSSSLWRFWSMRGYLKEGRQMMDKSIVMGESLSGSIRAKCLNATGILAELQGDYSSACKLYEEGLALERVSGNTNGIAKLLNNLGGNACVREDFEQAKKYYNESFILYKASENLTGMAITLVNIGTLAGHIKEFKLANESYMDSLSLYRQLQNQSGVAHCLHGLAWVATQQGNLRDAHHWFVESILCYHRLEEKQQILPCLEGFAAVAADEQAYTVAAKLYSVAEALRTSTGLASNFREEHISEIEQVQAQLDALSWECAWAEGQAMSLNQAVELVLAYDSQAEEGLQRMLNSH